MSTVSAPDSFDVQEQAAATAAAAAAPAAPPLDYASPSLARTERLVSLDALRGFDMFWILGADALIPAIARACNASETHLRPLHVVAAQLDHVAWEGFHF